VPPGICLNRSSPIDPQSTLVRFEWVDDKLLRRTQGLLLIRRSQMRWTLTCRDVGDGSGDVILDLPDDLLQAATRARAICWSWSPTLRIAGNSTEEDRVMRHMQCQHG